MEEDLLFLMCAEASIMGFKCSALEFDFNAYTRDFIRPKDSRPKD